MSILNRKIGLLLYIAILSLYIYTSYKIYEYPKKRKAPKFSIYTPKLKSYKYCFFTGWNYVIQIFFLVIAICDDFANLFKFSLRIRITLNRIRSFLFNTFIVPIGLLIPLVFWTVFLYDRELILPKELDWLIPLWVNHVLHTVIMLPIIIEFLLPKKYTFLSFKTCTAPLTLYLVTYQTMFFSIFLRDGVFLYIIYYQLTWPQRIAFTLMMYVLAQVFLKFGLVIQNSKRKSNRKEFKLC